MILDKPSDQIQCIKLFVPVIIIRQALNNLLDGIWRIIQGRKFILLCIIRCFVVNLMRLLFIDRGWLFDRKWLFWNCFCQWGKVLMFWALFLGKSSHGVFRWVRCVSCGAVTCDGVCISCLLLWSFVVDILLRLDYQALLFLNRTLLRFIGLSSQWIRL